MDIIGRIAYSPLNSAAAVSIPNTTTDINDDDDEVETMKFKKNLKLS